MVWKKLLKGVEDWMDAWVDGRLDAWVDGRLDGWVDEWESDG